MPYQLYVIKLFFYLFNQFECCCLKLVFVLAALRVQKCGKHINRFIIFNSVVSLVCDPICLKNLNILINVKRIIWSILIKFSFIPSLDLHKTFIIDVNLPANILEINVTLSENGIERGLPFVNHSYISFYLK